MGVFKRINANIGQVISNSPGMISFYRLTLRKDKDFT